MEISSSHKLIRIQGNDAFTFLQGQLSNDLELSNDSTFQKNALCNVKGRVISLIWIRRPEDSCFELYVCLLYTSPSPRDATLSRMPSSA